MFLLKDTTQWRRWGSNPRPSVSSQALYHWATALPIIMIVEAITMNPDQTDPKGAILSGYFAIFDT